MASLFIQCGHRGKGKVFCSRVLLGRTGKQERRNGGETLASTADKRNREKEREQSGWIVGGKARELREKSGKTSCLALPLRSGRKVNKIENKKAREGEGKREERRSLG